MSKTKIRLVLIQVAIAFLSMLGTSIFMGEVFYVSHGIACLECLLLRGVLIMCAAVLALFLPFIWMIAKNRALQLVHKLNIVFALVCLLMLFSSLAMFGLVGRSASPYSSDPHRIGLAVVLLIASFYLVAGAGLSYLSTVLLGRLLVKQKLGEIIEATEKLPGGGTR